MFVLGGGRSDWCIFQTSSAGSMSFGRAPKHVVHCAAQLDVIVSELAKLGIVEAQLLLLDRGAQTEAGDQVHHKENDTCDNERPREPSDAVSELIGQLDIVVVEPAAVDLGKPVKVSNIVATASS